MHKRKPVIVFNFVDISLEFGSIKETSEHFNISEGKVRRTIDRGIPVKTSVGKVFFDYKIEGYEDE